jgi:hypothetical protein
LFTILVDIIIFNLNMKRVLIFFLFFQSLNVLGQSSNDILNVLISNKTITQQQADSIRAEYAINQQNTTPDKILRVEFEYRPRAEYRNGYQILRNDSSDAAYFVNQRSRLSLNYSYYNRFILQFSVQDLRVWGQQDPRSTGATIQAFEAWVETFITDKLSVRVGRQRLMYDNQRLFAENDWRLSAAVHDALNIRYNNSNLSTELAVAYNQLSESYFATEYSPSGYTNYKFLAVHHLKYNITRDLILTTITSTDGFQVKNKPDKMNFRYTAGGRLEFSSGSLYGTVSGYYQGGKNPSGKDLSAWYFQPEVRYTSMTGTTIRAGFEYFTGTGNRAGLKTDRSFVPLYGVAHRFNGSMDLITKFPNDVGGAGLLNPYLFVIQPISKKIDLRSDFHTFHLQTDYYVSDKKIDRFLGFENDWLITYKPNPVLKLDVGLSYMLPTESFAIVKGGGDGKYNLTWAYVSLTFKPILFTTKFK